MSVTFDERDDSSKGSYAFCDHVELGVVCEQLLNLRSESVPFKSTSTRKRSFEQFHTRKSECIDSPPSSISSESEMPAKRPRNPLRLPRNPAKYYPEQVVKALNACDSSLLRQTLKKLSTKNLKIVKHVYPLYAPPNETEDATVTLEFPTIEAFCDYITTWYTFVPDGVFESFGHRIVVNGLPTFVFISCLSFQGIRIASKAVDLLHTPFETFHPSVHEEVVTSEVMRYGESVAQVCRLQGSLVSYVNKYGLLEKLEFYLCQH